MKFSNIVRYPKNFKIRITDAAALVGEKLGLQKKQDREEDTCCEKDSAAESAQDNKHVHD